MAEHTKGPWHFRPASPNSGYAYTVLADVNRVIADVCKRSNNEGIANAHVIGAAPDLLEALLLADACLRGANMNLSVVERKVGAALAKAEGKGGD